LILVSVFVDKNCMERKILFKDPFFCHSEKKEILKQMSVLAREKLI